MNPTNPIPIFEPECQLNPTRFCLTHTQPEYKVSPKIKPGLAALSKGQ